MPKTPEPTAGGGVYHESPRKRDEAGHKRQAAASRPSKGKGNAAGENLFRSSVRTMILVTLGMAAILGAAWLLAGKIWDLKHRKNTVDVENAMKRYQPEDKEFRGKIDIWGEGAAPLPPPVDFDTGKVKKAAYWAGVARAERGDGNLDGAVKHYRTSVEVWPHQPRVWRELGELYLVLKDLPRAKLSLQRAAESDPSNIAVLTGLGEVYLRENDLEKSEELLEAAQEIDPTYERTYYLLGKLSVAKNDDSEAMDRFKKYLGFNPDDAKALFEKAGIEARRRQFTLALETLKRAIVAEPEWAELYYQAAAAAALMNKIDEAVLYLEKGEAFTDPQNAYKIYQSRAFDLIRQSDIGKLYEEELADRVRRLLQERQEEFRE